VPKGKFKTRRRVMGKKMPEKCRECCAKGIFPCNDCIYTIGDWGDYLEEEKKISAQRIEVEESTLKNCLLV
jgi:hypothetical protein